MAKRGIKRKEALNENKERKEENKGKGNDAKETPPQPQRKRQKKNVQQNSQTTSLIDPETLLQELLRLSKSVAPTPTGPVTTHQRPVKENIGAHLDSIFAHFSQFTPLHCRKKSGTERKTSDMFYRAITKWKDYVFGRHHSYTTYLKTWPDHAATRICARNLYLLGSEQFTPHLSCFQFFGSSMAFRVYARESIFFQKFHCLSNEHLKPKVIQEISTSTPLLLDLVSLCANYMTEWKTATKEPEWKRYEREYEMFLQKTNPKIYDLFKQLL